MDKQKKENTDMKIYGLTGRQMGRAEEFLSDHKIDYSHDVMELDTGKRSYKIHISDWMGITEFLELARHIDKANQ